MISFLKKKSFSESPKSLTEGFYSSYYQAHNIARLQHLDSLNLDLSRKKILELGAGVGDHTLFYLFRNCEILPIEGRMDLVQHVKTRLGIDSALQMDFEKDLEKLKKIKDLTSFIAMDFFII